MKTPRPHKASPLMSSSTRRRCEFPSEVLSNRRATRRPRGVGLQYGRPIRVQCERWLNQMKMKQSLTFTLNRTESKGVKGVKADFLPCVPALCCHDDSVLRYKHHWAGRYAGHMAPKMFFFLYVFNHSDYNLTWCESVTLANHWILINDLLLIYKVKHVE